MKIIVYTPQPQEEPVLRLNLRPAIGIENALSLSVVDRDGIECCVNPILIITERGIKLCSSKSGLPTDDKGRVRIVP